jgi:hypothetical protein
VDIDWVNNAISKRLGITNKPAPTGVNYTPVGVGPGIPHRPPVKANPPTKAAPAKPKAPAKKKTSTSKKKQSALDKWLAGDTTYQQQLSNYNKEKSDYQAQYNTQVGKTNRDYNTTQRSMNQQAVKDRDQQANDFAGRGILHSGVYAKALGDYNSDFNTKLTNLLQGRTDSLGDLSSDHTNFLRQIALDLQSAKQDAIRRRAEKLGI